MAFAVDTYGLNLLIFVDLKVRNFDDISIFQELILMEYIESTIPDLYSTISLNVFETPFKPVTQYCSSTVALRGVVSTTCRSSLWKLILL